jgi:AcrR family transcriptional regulator
MPVPVNEAKAGRPRREEARRRVLKIALNQVFDIGFRAVTVESIAAEAAVAKTTIYRHWPNKAAVVMDAFLMEMEPVTLFPPHEQAIESIRLQMRSQIRQFRGKFGILLSALIGEAQVDKEMHEALQIRWYLPRRLKFKEVLKMAVKQGDLRNDLDLEVAIDMIYAPVYHRLLFGHAPLTDSFMDLLLEELRAGISPSGSE